MRTSIPAQRVAALRQVPLFRSYSERDLVKIDALVDDIEVPAGEVIVREGRRGREAFVIVSGSATVEIKGRVVATLRAGDFFGEMALLDFAGRTATVRAKTPMHLLVVGAGHWDTFLDQPMIARRLLEGVSARLRAVDMLQEAFRRLFARLGILPHEAA